MNTLPATVVAAEVLNTSEVRALAAHEDVIQRGMATFVDVGTSLAAIRDARLYRAEHGTFEDYCRVRWGMGKAYAFRVIAAAEVVNNVSPMGDKPETERQARPLAKLPPAQQPIAWRAATAAAAADSRPVTAKDVARAVQAIVRESNPKPEEEEKGQPPPDDPKEPPKPGTAMYHAAGAIECMRKIKESDPARAAAYRWVREWVTRHE